MRKELLKYKYFKKNNIFITSGIVFLYDNKILLLHSPNEKWDSSFSYPKGHVKKGESIKNAAIRETEEEIGVKIKKSLLKNDNLYRMVDREGDIKIDYYYVLDIDDKLFKEYFKKNLILKKKRLQKNEIDWGGFLDIKKANNMIKKRLKSVLYHMN